MNVRLTLTICCALLFPLQLIAGQPYLVTQRFPGEILLLEDLNNDGDALDAGEVKTWADGLSSLSEIDALGSTVYAVEEVLDRVIRLQDQNGDGDALDVGESIVWADGFSAPWGLIHDDQENWYVPDRADNAVWRLTDLNADGDALDAGEKVLYADGILQSLSAIFSAGGLFVSSFAGDSIYRVVDSNGDGDALDVGESVVVASGIDGAANLYMDADGRLLVSSLISNTVYLGEDLNSDGDFLDVGEMLPFADNVFGGLLGPLGISSYETGGLLLANRNASRVLHVLDVNGDGDALDLGEVTVFADGISGGPADIIALPAAYNADYNENGNVDAPDFLKWQRGESPQPVSDFDLELWESQFGTAVTFAAAMTVPEPDAALQLVGMLWLAIGWQRKYH